MLIQAAARRRRTPHPTAFGKARESEWNCGQRKGNCPCGKGLIFQRARNVRPNGLAECSTGMPGRYGWRSSWAPVWQKSSTTPPARPGTGCIPTPEIERLDFSYPNGTLAKTPSQHRVCSASQTLQILQRFVQTHDVRESGLDVEQCPFVGDLRAVLDTFPDNDGSEFIALRIGRGCPDARAG